MDAAEDSKMRLKNPPTNSRAVHLSFLIHGGSATRVEPICGV